MVPVRDTAVVMACDEGYLPYAFCLAETIARLHPDRDFDLCVFTPAPADPPAGLAVPDLRVIAPREGNPFLDAQRDARHGMATYLRLLVPSEVAGRYRRVLYLDSDMLPLGGGLDELLGAELHGAALGAVRDNQQWRTPARQVVEFRRATLPAAPYFNAGLLLIDVERFNSERILDRTIALMRSRPDLTMRHDQSLLNLVQYRRWTELSPVWNWQFSWATRFFAGLAEPRLLHFIGPRKPWKDERAELPASYRRVYRDFQQRCYPDHPEIAPADPDRPAWPDRAVRTFVKHAVSAERMRRYLQAFPRPTVTLPPAAPPGTSAPF